ncbi:MAG: heavy metal translocating P-type ATPase [Treponema sp.]|nr:heavy metal translocating P-type ATPase [Treponema sp.]
MEQYNVTGMSCAACSARVEKAVSKLEGVTSCSVSLLTNSMGVEGSASKEAIIAAVEEAGYGACVKGNTKSKDTNASSMASMEDSLKDKETPVLKKRLIYSIGFLIVLMYFSMGHTMFNLPLPTFFKGNYVAIGLLQLMLSAIIMVINQKFFISGFKSLFHLAPNMDTLVALGSASSFLYSSYALFLMTASVINSDTAKTMSLMHELYFESAAMILTLITVGKMLESISKGRTTDALKSLMKLAPKTAVLIKKDSNGKESEQKLPIEDVNKDDIFVVRPGENIPVDGIVIEGSTAINEASLTGESIPVDKVKGDSVSAATINMSGFIKCKATRVGEDTTLSKIIQMVSDAAATKAPIAKIADKVSGIFVPVVISIAIVTTVIWLLLGESFGFALARGISVLVISCPCALGLATPVAIMVGNGKAARNGILFKNASSLEIAGKSEIVALDKTGTITKGEPKVVDIICAEGIAEKELLTAAYSLEVKSEHPLAKAIVEKAKEEGLEAFEVKDFISLSGNGLSAIYDNKKIVAGSVNFVKGQCDENVAEDILSKAVVASESGKTPLLFAADKKLLGMIAVADTIKDDSAEAINELKNMGIRVVMLTGDNEKTASAIGKSAGVDEVYAGVLPDGKEKVIRTLKEQGKVCMVGDGINDAPALTRADVGVAIGAGTDVAIDAADIVLMKSSLKDVVSAIKLSRATLMNIKENLFWAFFYNIIGIPLACGVYIHLFGWKLNPMFGAAAMSMSSFCVVTNALRLNLFNMHKALKSRKINSKAMEVHKVMADVTEKTVKVEGMMCGHCEARVKKAVEAINGVVEAIANHETGTVTVKASAPVSDEDLKKAIEAQDYKFIG